VFSLRRATFGALDVGASLLAYPAGLLLREIRRIGVERLPACKAALTRAEVFPIRAHYYEPQFDFRNERRSFSAERALPGVAWNIDGQLALLASLSYADEVADLSMEAADQNQFHLQNTMFEAGDAEVWYQIGRLKKPRRIYEIGSGYSTLLAARAIQRNREENTAYACKHVCVEPFEAPWLAQTGVTIVRERVETLGAHFFADLQKDDILFIDSSHMIRPDGDVLFEYLELLPTLNSGVIVHVHDIFSPRNYPAAWLIDQVKFWNEQYLLEAFLTHNHDWRIIAALNYLQHNHFDTLKKVAPFLTTDREPGSFYIQRT
jgi:predicted O-methyltransferase YrrM